MGGGRGHLRWCQAGYRHAEQGHRVEDLAPRAQDLPGRIRGRPPLGPPSSPGPGPGGHQSGQGSREHQHSRQPPPETAGGSRVTPRRWPGRTRPRNRRWRRLGGHGLTDLVEALFCERDGDGGAGAGTTQAPTGQRRGRIERHPAQASEVDLGPYGGIRTRDRRLVAGPVDGAGSETHHQPAGESDGARHRARTRWRIARRCPTSTRRRRTGGRSSTPRSHRDRAQSRLWSPAAAQRRPLADRGGRGRPSPGPQGIGGRPGSTPARRSAPPPTPRCQRLQRRVPTERAPIGARSR